MAHFPDTLIADIATGNYDQTAAETEINRIAAEVFNESDPLHQYFYRIGEVIRLTLLYMAPESVVNAILSPSAADAAENRMLTMLQTGHMALKDVVWTGRKPKDTASATKVTFTGFGEQYGTYIIAGTVSIGDKTFDFQLA